MNNANKLLDQFIMQAQEADLRTAHYPKQHESLSMKISFGMGVSAKIPWIAFTAPEMRVSNGFYPVYLYYKEQKTLILAYGISETSEFEESWPPEVMNSASTIKSFFGKNVHRYGSSFVFRAYNIDIKINKVEYLNKEGLKLSESELESDLQTILNYYRKLVSIEINKEDSLLNQGLFYMEKQLEDFIIHNWNNTELGKRFELIFEEGELLSQQYKTGIGIIDILAKDKETGNYVVIELKRNQSSDDTVGQLTRYMGWIKDKKNSSDVKGIIIAGDFDEKLKYSMQMVPNIEVFLYKVDFTLKEFKGI